MDAEEAVWATKDAVVSLPAGFMLDGATYERGGELGFTGMDFYVAGRGGALGDVDGEVVAAAFVFFNPAGIVEAWDRSGPVMARRAAAQAFAGCLESWAQAHLSDDVDCARWAEMLGRVNGAASTAAAPLFAAWKVVGEPDDPKALALHRLNVLRELRGALHGGAVIASGLGPLQALLVNTPGMAPLFGWSEPYPDVGSCRAVWDGAEAATSHALSHAYGALDQGELAELVDLSLTAHKAAT
jgi:hypothetical protein